MNKVPCLVTPVFAEATYGVWQVMSVAKGSGFGVQTVEPSLGWSQLAVVWTIGLPQDVHIVKVQVAVHVPPLAGKFVKRFKVPGEQFVSWGLAPLAFTVTFFPLLGEPVWPSWFLLS